MKRLICWISLFIVSFAPGVAHAHIGNTTVIFDGAAGGYKLRVVIRPPVVVPGRAEIDVRFLEADADAAKITVLPVNWRAGLKGAPPPDEAMPVPGDPLLKHAELWLMTSGSYSVHVDVAGARGSGKLIVPINSVATQRLGMPRVMGAVLIGLGGLLLAGAVTLVGVGVRETILPPGQQPSPTQRRTGNIVGVGAFLVFSLLLYGGKSWWDSVDTDYRKNRIFRPMQTSTQVSVEKGQRILRLFLAPKAREDVHVKLAADHGKLMHCFLIREQGLDVFAHVHPLQTGDRRFELSIPPIPAGRYRMYADITLENGFSETLTDVVDIPESPNAASTYVIDQKTFAADPDDSWFVPSEANAQNISLVRTDREKLMAGAPVMLSFKAQGVDGVAVPLETYMGMFGHAAVRRDDGSVFSHIHPVGTISMASQSVFERQFARQGGGADAAEDHAHHHMSSEAETSVSFPYEFSKPGNYRIWVQTKVHGEVVTGTFDVVVAP